MRANTVKATAGLYTAVKSVHQHVRNLQDHSVMPNTCDGFLTRRQSWRLKRPRKKILDDFFSLLYRFASSQPEGETKICVCDMVDGLFGQIFVIIYMDAGLERSAAANLENTASQSETEGAAR